MPIKRLKRRPAASAAFWLDGLLPAAGLCLMLLAAGLFWPAVSAAADEPPVARVRVLPLEDGKIDWKTLDQGFEFADVPLKMVAANGEGDIPLQGFILVRIAPEFYEFTLHMASESKERLSLPQWAERNGLCAVVNAGMYLPDNLTNTGYMRNAGHVNNGRLSSKFGAFFVAGPKVAGLPNADLLDRQAPDKDWEKLIASYDVVVQNYRLVSDGGKTLWPAGGPAHSIAAVSRDGAGRILFILCRAPLPAADFAALLLGLPLNLRCVMYVEGGAQAGILVRAGRGAEAVNKVWKGQSAGLLTLPGNVDAPLPNVLGVRKRSAK